MKKYIIDRFEGDIAVCVNKAKEKLHLPKTELPNNAKEGDCLIMKEDGNIIIDSIETAVRKSRIKEMVHRLTKQ